MFLQSKLCVATPVRANLPIHKPHDNYFSLGNTGDELDRPRYAVNGRCWRPSRNRENGWCLPVSHHGGDAKGKQWCGGALSGRLPNVQFGPGFHRRNTPTRLTRKNLHEFQSSLMPERFCPSYSHCIYTKATKFFVTGWYAVMQFAKERSQ